MENEYGMTWRDYFGSVRSGAGPTGGGTRRRPGETGRHARRREIGRGQGCQRADSFPVFFKSNGRNDSWRSRGR